MTMNPLVLGSLVPDASSTPLQTGNDLLQNAQAMLDHADRLRRGMGYPVR